MNSQTSSHWLILAKVQFAFLPLWHCLTSVGARQAMPKIFIAITDIPAVIPLNYGNQPEKIFRLVV